MGIVERREKEKNRMKEKIIKASIKIFVKNGYENTSMRKIAQEIEYSPTTIYLYFKNKTELFYHIHESLFEKLYKNLLSKTDFETPIERLRFIAKSFVSFAINNKESYRLLLVIKTPSTDINNENTWNFGIKCLSLFENAIDELQIDLNGFQKESLTFSLISYLHGISSLTIQERIPEKYKSNIDELINEAISLINNFIQKIKS